MTHSSPSLHGARGEHLRVGAGLRLGHRVAREALAVEQRLQVLLLLRLGAVVGDDLGVAGVGRGGAEHDRRPARRAEDLVDQRQLELAEALAAELGTQVRAPTGPAPRTSSCIGRTSGPVSSSSGWNGAVREDQVERLDLLAHELADPLQLRLELGLGLEVPRHRVASLWSCSTTGPRSVGPASPRMRARLHARPRWRTPRRSPSAAATRRRRPGRAVAHQLLDRCAPPAVRSPAILPPSARASSTSVPLGTTRLISPSSSARAASNVSPVSVISSATASGIRVASSVPPPPGMSPRFTSANPNITCSAATTRSQHNMISKPPPTVAPLSAATIGFG